MSENSQTSNVTPPPSARVDLITAAILLAFALSVFALALRMPTFVATGGSAFTAPGIVPGFHATVIGVLAAVLAVRSILRGALKPGGGKVEGHEGLPAISLKRLFIAAGLGIVFAVVLVGLVPFWLAVALFVTAFTTIFEWEPTAPVALRARRVVTAAVLGICAGAAVHYLFQEVFLVRLP